MNILNKINDPKDLKNLSLAELTALADEIRQTLIVKVKRHRRPFWPEPGLY